MNIHLNMDTCLISLAKETVCYSLYNSAYELIAHVWCPHFVRHERRFVVPRKHRCFWQKERRYKAYEFVEVPVKSCNQTSLTLVQWLFCNVSIGSGYSDIS